MGCPLPFLPLRFRAFESCSEAESSRSSTVSLRTRSRLRDRRNTAMPRRLARRSPLDQLVPRLEWQSSSSSRGTSPASRRARRAPLVPHLGPPSRRRGLCRAPCLLFLAPSSLKAARRSASALALSASNLNSRSRMAADRSSAARAAASLNKSGSAASADGCRRHLKQRRGAARRTWRPPGRAARHRPATAPRRAAPRAARAGRGGRGEQPSSRCGARRRRRRRGVAPGGGGHQ